MVEIKLDLCEEITEANDCFVSVRVGDYQKLSRLAASRTYRFPQANDRHYGKIEVFKRIGATAVSIDPLSDDMRKVVVSCNDSNVGNLGFKVAVGTDEVSKKKIRTAREAEAAEAGTKATMAKEYLAQHCLEVRLSEAMQALLRERPDNPTEFLAQKLLSFQDMGGTIVPSPTSKAKPTPAPVSPKAAGASRSIVPTPEQYREMACRTFAMKFSAGISRIHEKFPTAAAASPPVPPFVFQPSVGTWLQKAPAKNSAVAKAADTQVTPKKLWVHSPSVGTWLAKPTPLAISKDKPKTDGWNFRPSVGSWLMMAPKKEVEPPKPNKMIVHMAQLYGPMFHGAGFKIL